MITKRRETVDIIGELIALIDYTFTASTFTDNGDGTYTFGTCFTMHLQRGFDLTIGGNTYTITEVIHNESITVSGSPALDGTIMSFTTYQAKYRYGTVIATKNEIDKKENSTEVVPLIYLREVFDETLFERDQIMDRESPLDLYFLTSVDTTNEENDIRKDGVKPMRNLLAMFLNVLKNNKNIGKFESGIAKDYMRFGTLTDKGTIKEIFSYCNSGVEYRVTVPIARRLACCLN